jgi:hypothetical protein
LSLIGFSLVSQKLIKVNLKTRRKKVMKKYFIIPAIFFTILFPCVISYAQGRGVGMDTDKQVSLIIRPSDYLLISLGTNILFADLGEIEDDTVSIINNIGVEIPFSPENKLSPFFGFNFGLEFVPRDYEGEIILRFQPGIGVEYFPDEKFSMGGKIAPSLVVAWDGDTAAGLALDSKLFVRWYF